MFRRLLTFLGYLIAVVLITGLTIVLVAFGRGYSYNFKTHQVVRNGLLLLNSQPPGAEITIQGKDTHHHTGYRVTLPVGTYSVSVAGTGFRTWQKTLQIAASEVTFAQYILLIPEHLNLQTVTPISSSVAPVQSTDLKEIAYVADENNDDLYVVSSGGTNQKKVWQVPAPTGAPSSPAGQISQISWSDDDSHLLVVTESGGQATDWLVAANGSGATNLTSTFGLDLGQVVFAPGTWQHLYSNDADGLRLIDVSGQTVSGVMATNVLQLSLSDEHLFYVQQGSLGRTLMSIDRSGKKQEVAQALADSDSYSVAADTLSGHDYVAVVPSQTHTATVYIDPSSSQPSTKVISRAADTVLFSPNGHYLLAGSTAGSIVYDIDRSTTTNSTVLYGLGALGPAPRDFVWLDNFHLLYRSQGNLMICEFDGGNSAVLVAQSLSAAAPFVNGHGFDVLAQHHGQPELDQLNLEP